MANAIPRAGSGGATQSSNTNNGVTADRVGVTTTYGAGGRHGFTVSGGDWSISTANGNPNYLPGDSGFDGVELLRRVNGGTLYVDVYSDIEAPASRQAGGGDDGTRAVPLGTLVAGRNFNGSFGGNYSNDNSNIGGESGHLRCSGGCTIVNGIATAGFWTFTPNRSPGAVDVTGVSGVRFTGEFDPARTTGTYNGQPGYFRCLSLSCGRSITNGRISALEGQWIFIPAGGTATATTPDTDYLSGGIWLFVPDDATSANDAVLGAFADGSDPFVQGNIRGLAGTAGYDGVATGGYWVYSVSSGETEAGYWNGAVALTADFGGAGDMGTIRGRVTGFEVDDESTPGSLTLGSAAIGSSNSGFFHGQLSGSVDGIGYTGRWGGSFFGNGEAHGQPGSVGGTLGGGASNSAGSVAFTGVFGAYNDRNRQ